jgi:hypothetical protein
MYAPRQFPASKISLQTGAARTFSHFNERFLALTNVDFVKRATNGAVFVGMRAVTVRG